MAKDKGTTAAEGFADLFGRLESALNDASDKKAKADKLTVDLATAQQEFQDAVTAVKALQAEYASRVGGVHPDLAPGVTASA